MYSKQIFIKVAYIVQFNNNINKDTNFLALKTCIILKGAHTVLCKPLRFTYVFILTSILFFYIHL